MKGSVVYIDLLGFSNLTIDIQNASKRRILERYLVGIHRIVFDNINSSGIDYVILSDSIFLYTINGNNTLLLRLSNIFRQAIKSGILLRAGLSFGEYYIMETALNKKNLYGPAVTQAVQLEKTGKGCRIFIDDSYPAETEFGYHQNLFQEFRDFKDYSYVDTFAWPLINREYQYLSFESDSRDRPNVNLRNLIFENYVLTFSLWFSPLFDWNFKDTNGRKHLNATIEYISTINGEILEKYDHFNLEPRIETVYLEKPTKRRRFVVQNLVDEVGRELGIERGHRVR